MILACESFSMAGAWWVFLNATAMAIATITFAALITVVLLWVASRLS